MGKPDREVEERNGRIKNFGPVLKVLSLLALLLILYFLFPSQKALNSGPYSEHMWRQSDGHAMTYNLYLDSSSLLKPRTLDLDIGKEARGGMEFQLMYYLAAHWDSIFGGYSSATLNWFHFLLLSVGFLAFAYRCFSINSKQGFSFYLISLLLLSSIWSAGLLQYYGMNNFPDIAALGSTLLAFSIFPSEAHKDTSKLMMSSLFFLIAGLLKVSFLVFPIAIFGVFILFPLQKKARLAYSIAFVLILILTALWIIYIKSYNAQWNSSGFLTSFLPVWDLEAGEKDWIWQRLKSEYLPRLLIYPLWYVLGILFALNLYYSPFRHKLIQLASLIGLILYIMLFYAQFSVHSYYLIVCYPLFLMTIYYFLRFSWKKWPSSKATLWIILGLLLLFNYKQFKHSHHYLTENYSPDNPHHVYSNITDAFLNEDRIEELLESNDISQNARFISYPDGSTNVSLHTLKRYGWSIPKGEFSKEMLKDPKYQAADYLIHWGVREGKKNERTLDLPLLDSLSDGTKLYKLEN